MESHRKALRGLRMLSLSAMLGTLGLAGCASLSEGQCLSADWYALGFEDANRGHDSGRLSAHIDACQEYGVRPDAETYGEGHRAGLLTFCTPRGGYEYGLAGSYYGNTCPGELEGEFLDGFHLATEILRADQEMQTLATDIDQLEDDLEAEADEAARRSLRRRIRDLDAQRGRLRRHIDRLHEEADRL